MKMKQTNGNHTSVHHIKPRSRGGKTEASNLANINRKNHQNYHQLFENKTPEEIIDWLVNYFWKSKDGKNGKRFLLKWLDANSYFLGGYE